MVRGKTEKQTGRANPRFEATLWAATDKPRGSIETDSFHRDLHKDLKGTPPTSHVFAGVTGRSEGLSGAGRGSRTISPWIVSGPCRGA